jgi:epoxyqueuosine reductase
MTPAILTSDPAAWIESVIREFTKSAANTLQNIGDDPAWAEPLVGFSRGDDPLYQQYKEYVGPFHLTPLEMFSQTFTDSPVSGEDLSVICWILPQTEATKADNRQQTMYPAQSWARSRIYGEQFNDKLRQHVVDALAEQGVPAMAPLLSPLFEGRPSDEYVFASTWSERHAAYASGLGTFGLCDGLITPVGKAIRVGSAIALLRVAPTPRPYRDHQAYCLFLSEGSCGVCIERCPVGALSKEGHDKLQCRDHLRRTADYVREHYHFEGYGCGLCQTGVPCESLVPGGLDLRE